MALYKCIVSHQQSHYTFGGYFVCRSNTMNGVSSSVVFESLSKVLASYTAHSLAEGKGNVAKISDEIGIVSSLEILAMIPSEGSLLKAIIRET